MKGATSLDSKGTMVDVNTIEVRLNGKSASTVMLYFQPRKIDEKRIETISEIGTNFSISFDYVLFDFKDESESHHSVSFTDIKTQKN